MYRKFAGIAKFIHLLSLPLILQLACTGRQITRKEWGEVKDKQLPLLTFQYYCYSRGWNDKSCTAEYAEKIIRAYPIDSIVSAIFESEGIVIDISEFKKALESSPMIGLRPIRKTTIDHRVRPGWAWQPRDLNVYENFTGVLIDVNMERGSTHKYGVSIVHNFALNSLALKGIGRHFFDTFSGIYSYRLPDSNLPGMDQIYVVGESESISTEDEVSALVLPRVQEHTDRFIDCIRKRGCPILKEN